MILLSQSDQMRRVSGMVCQGYLPHEAIDAMPSWRRHIRARFEERGKTLTDEQVETILNMAALYPLGLDGTIDFLLSLGRVGDV